MNGFDRQSPQSAALTWGLALAYGLLLSYGTLFPLEHWTTPGISPWQLMAANARRHTSWADLVTNLLVYIPLGLLLMRALMRRRSCPACRWFLVVLAGSALSAGLEYLQAWLPGRTPSFLDLGLNALGTALGASLGILVDPAGPVAARLRRWRHAWFPADPAVDLGLAALALWALAQLSPLVPSLDLANLRQGIKPLWLTLQGDQPFTWLVFGADCAALLGLGLLYRLLQRLRHGAAPRFLSLVAAVLLLKILVVGRQLSAETVAAFGATVLLLPPLGRLNAPQARALGAVLLILAMLLEALAPGQGNTSGGFNWIPFRGHLSNDLVGIMDILAGVWPIVALAALAQLPPRLGNGWLAASGLGLASGLFFLEWLQRNIPGRSADITDVLVAVAAWAVSWLYLVRGKRRHQAAVEHESDTPPAESSRWRGPALVLGLASIGVILTAVLLLPRVQTEPSPTEAQALPPIEAAPPLDLPRFRYGHPRLPAPSQAEIAALEAANPGFIRRTLRRARGGDGPLTTVILAERLRPGSQDLAKLHQRLMALEPRWRGHQQAKPLALAYDWLHDRWSPDQRRALAGKVEEAARYIIEFIRKEKLSPYNVYLYNSPLQGLMAAALAVYGDRPSADGPMRWVAAYWKGRVLPVWRQVMGNNGGWHEGAEYVGIGIGQAVWSLPAMWRSAVGEDLIATTPGIFHFNDFLLYRTRPDGSQMRWGDGRFFDRRSPDALPLAVETGHWPTLEPRCPRRLKPVGWPWGPLLGPDDCPAQHSDPPLTKHFDGIGLLIARSDWSDRATWISFKASDNFWSHTHLDQGSFTLYKDRPLIIDSGYYGPGYGSDHHLNYAYQSIAHNLVTVTDPEDRVPMPPKKRQDPPRPIANDGGQRRIGSGWGRRAPLDIEEWNREREIYHTATLARYFDEDDLVVAVADLTPAYTNRMSGTGTFAHRTFRVRHYWRTFIYDRSEDVLIVEDDVISADPSFRKRALLHTLSRPEPTPDGFELTVPAEREGESAGHLAVHVIFPRNARKSVVGGPGREFFVDGKNYDADGRIWQLVDRMRPPRPEPGRWRMEITPARPRHRDLFLTVLVPGRRTLPPLVETLTGTGERGVRIVGTQRTLVVRFPLDREGPLIEVRTPDSRRLHDLTLPRAPLVEPPAQSLWARIRKLWDD